MPSVYILSVNQRVEQFVFLAADDEFGGVADFDLAFVDAEHGRGRLRSHRRSNLSHIHLFLPVIIVCF